MLAIALVAAIAPAQAAPSTKLQFLGQQIFPTATQFQGTDVRRPLLASPTTSGADVFYALSDDQVGARFYTLRIAVGSGGPSVQIVAVTTLRDAAGQPFAPRASTRKGWR